MNVVNGSAYSNALGFQYLLANSSRDAERRCHASRKCATAARVLVTLVFDVSCIVGMTGPGCASQRGVVGGFDVRVVYNCLDLFSGCHTVLDPADEFRVIRLLARCR